MIYPGKATALLRQEGEHPGDGIHAFRALIGVEVPRELGVIHGQHTTAGVLGDELI